MRTRVLRKHVRQGKPGDAGARPIALSMIGSKKFPEKVRIVKGEISYYDEDKNTWIFLHNAPKTRSHHQPLRRIRRDAERHADTPRRNGKFR